MSLLTEGDIVEGDVSLSKAAINRLRKSSFEISGPMYSFRVPFLHNISHPSMNIEPLHVLNQDNSREL